MLSESETEFEGLIPEESDVNIKLLSIEPEKSQYEDERQSLGKNVQMFVFILWHFNLPDGKQQLSISWVLVSYFALYSLESTIFLQIYGNQMTYLSKKLVTVPKPVLL